MDLAFSDQNQGEWKNIYPYCLGRVPMRFPRSFDDEIASCEDATFALMSSGLAANPRIVLSCVLVTIYVDGI